MRLMRLVPDWRRCWRWHSMQGMGGAIGCLIWAWEQMPERMKQEFPARWVIGLAVVMLLGGAIGRLRDQSKPEPIKPTVPDPIQRQPPA